MRIKRSQHEVNIKLRDLDDILDNTPSWPRPAVVRVCKMHKPTHTDAPFHACSSAALNSGSISAKQQVVFLFDFQRIQRFLCGGSVAQRHAARPAQGLGASA